MSKNFYTDLDQRAFWRSGVADSETLAPLDIYRKKWPIGKNWKIGTAGSCFAQHIARYLKQNGYQVLDIEPAPKALPPEKRQAYGYELYSGRYGNIYTTRQFRQLVEEVFGEVKPEPLIWEEGGRFFDAIRPNIEPAGFATRNELIAARRYHLERLRLLFESVDLFVFTMGLTEAWMDRESGRIVPIAPGVIAGSDSIKDYDFVNFTYDEVVADFRKAMRMLNENRKKRMRFILTVSPVPLTATATSNHVLAATTYSKSVLRAAAGFLSDSHANIDYFPSFEIVTNPAARGTFFAGNLRSVRSEGVATVMTSFFSEHPPHKRTGKQFSNHVTSAEDLQCEEALLEAFGK